MILDGWPEGVEISGDECKGEVSYETNKFRYAFWKCWDPAKCRVLFVMLNPSTRDEAERRPHPTRLRCERFAGAWWDCGTLFEGNLYGLRSPHPRELKKAPDAVEALNDQCVRRMREITDKTVVAWGNGHGVPPSEFDVRERKMVDLLKETSPNPIFCLGQTVKRHPYHPLYRPRNTRPEVFR